MSKSLPIAAFAVVLAAGGAHAFPQFETKVPNGRTFGCITCHVRTGGGEGWNDFGQEILRQGGGDPAANPTNMNLGFSGEPDWASLCDLDSDGDGVANKVELNDPDCAWAIGDPDPTGGTVSAPGDKASVPDDPGEPPADNGRDTLPPGGCSSTPAGPSAALALLLGVLLVRRRR